jgi:hypothetical protein
MVDNQPSKIFNGGLSDETGNHSSAYYKNQIEQLTQKVNQQKLLIDSIIGKQATNKTFSQATNKFPVHQASTSTQQASTRVVKIVIDNKESYDKVLQDGHYIGKTSFRVNPWIFEEGPIQCTNCQRFGHKR